eukprot:COSAG06_NODE_38253_length_425_cov_1.420245_1_plen_78_part_00
MVFAFSQNAAPQIALLDRRHGISSREAAASNHGVKHQPRLVRVHIQPAFVLAAPVQRLRRDTELTIRSRADKPRRRL